MGILNTRYKPYVATTRNVMCVRVYSPLAPLTRKQSWRGVSWFSTWTKQGAYELPAFLGGNLVAG